jgi:hypothetical protein
VVLHWEVAYGRSYKLQVSDDQINWTSVFSTASSDGGADDITNLSAAGRYVRMLGLLRATQWGFSLWEFQVFGVPVTPGSDAILPVTFSLEQNYPNPFNPDTQIKYSLPSEANVKLEIFNLLSRKVATLVNTKQSKGTCTVTFNGQGLPSGIYFYRLEAGEHRQVRRMILAK